MILQSLVDYYDRKGDLANDGWEWKRIPYIIEIREDGSFVQLSSLRIGKKPTDVTPSLVPKAEIRSGTKSYEKPNALWDHFGFVAGHPKSNEPHEVKTAENQLNHFRGRIASLYNQAPTSKGLGAVHSFYETGEFHKIKHDALWSECIATKGCNMSFRLLGESDLVVNAPEISKLFLTDTDAETGERLSAQCLITGEAQDIQRLHFPIAGVAEKPTPLAAINDGVSPAFSSFGKHKGENFPTGKQAVFKYTTALNELLRPGSRQKVRVGSDVFVFWSDRETEFEDAFGGFFGITDNPDAQIDQARATYLSLRTGVLDEALIDRKFFILGLSSNSGRLVVRFWRCDALENVAHHLKRWFHDLDIQHSDKESRHLGVLNILRSVVLKGEDKHIPPNLGSDVVRAVLAGTALPATLLNAAVQRCRAERQVPYVRAAVIKACINRMARQQPSSEEELPVMLDTTLQSPAYRLGRLFATLEKIQEEASPGLNVTIRERYYGAASSTPVTVFTTLMRLKNHHLAKLGKGRAVNLEKLLAEIMSGIQDFPVHLPLPEQGRFAVGYYHQRQAFFTKTPAAESTETASDATETPAT